MSKASVNVAVVGLSFGREFVPIYMEHPDVGKVTICDADRNRLDRVGDEFGVAERFESIEDVLVDESIDAVHLVTPVETHVPFAVSVLSAGKHCAVAVPLARDLEGVDAVIAAEATSGKRYMMMETAVYSREYLFVEELQREGKLGDVTLLRGVNIQDLDGFPREWQGYPPMHYITHSLAPLLALVDDRVESVTCFGTGHLPAHITSSYENSFPVETGLFKLAEHDIVAEVCMAYFGFSRDYQEGFSVYGHQLGFEWNQLDGEQPIVFEPLPLRRGEHGRRFGARRVEPPDRQNLLPKSIAPFTQRTDYAPRDGRAGKVALGGGHGGSHPHLVHEFMRAIVEDRDARVSSRVAADWTVPGIVAHSSAMAGGKPIAVRGYR